MNCPECKRKMRKFHKAPVRNTLFIVWACRCGNFSLEKKALSMKLFPIRERLQGAGPASEPFFLWLTSHLSVV